MKKDNKKIQVKDDKELLSITNDDPNIDRVLSVLNEEFGSGTVLRLDENNSKTNIKWATGIYSLDSVLGGGIPQGCIIEIFGKEGSGKTTLALQSITNIINKNPDLKVMYFDTESANLGYFLSLLGQDNVKRCYLVQSNLAEEVMEIACKVLEKKLVNIIVIDSIAGLIPRNEIDSNMGDVTIAGLARVMSNSIKRLIPYLNSSKSTLIAINQLRQKVTTFGSGGEITTGGNAIKYFSSIRLELAKTSLISQSEQCIGTKVKIKAVKNKFNAPFQEREIALYFGKGFDTKGDVLDIAIEKGVIRRNGAWYMFEGENIAKGREAASIFISENDVILKKIQESL